MEYVYNHDDGFSSEFLFLCLSLYNDMLEVLASWLTDSLAVHAM